MRKSRSPGTLLIALKVAALSALGACDDPTAASAPTPSLTAASVPVLAAAPREAWPHDTTDFADVVSRLLPSFEDQSIAAELQAQLEGFARAYQADDDIAARRAIADSEILLARSGVHPANVGAVRLALARAQAMIGATSTDTPPQPTSAAGTP